MKGDLYASKLSVMQNDKDVAVPIPILFKDQCFFLSIIKLLKF